MKKSDSVKRELELIRKAGGGLLRPADVVERARPEDSVLHDCFEWDDSDAAEKYRIWQARQLIKVVVQVMPQAPNQVQSVYVSMVGDRTTGEGYRRLVDVMGTEQLRLKLLAQAAKEFDAWEQKYVELVELSEVFAAMKGVRKKAKRSESYQQITAAV